MLGCRRAEGVCVPWAWLMGGMWVCTFNVLLVQLLINLVYQTEQNAAPGRSVEAVMQAALILQGGRLQQNVALCMQPVVAVKATAGLNAPRC